MREESSNSRTRLLYQRRSHVITSLRISSCVWCRKRRNTSQLPSQKFSRLLLEYQNAGSSNAKTKCQEDQNPQNTPNLANRKILPSLWFFNRFLSPSIFSSKPHRWKITQNWSKINTILGGHLSGFFQWCWGWRIENFANLHCAKPNGLWLNIFWHPGITMSNANICHTRKGS